MYFLKKTFVLTLPEPGLNAPALSAHELTYPVLFKGVCVQALQCPLLAHDTQHSRGLWRGAGVQQHRTGTWTYMGSSQPQSHYQSQPQSQSHPYPNLTL